MANPDEAARQHVEQQAPYKLQGRQPHDPLAVTVSVVLVPKPDESVLDIEQASVSDCYPMRVSGQYFNTTSGPPKGRLA